jgi:hypothetical protein
MSFFQVVNNSGNECSSGERTAMMFKGERTEISGSQWWSEQQNLCSVVTEQRNECSTTKR